MTPWPSSKDIYFPIYKCNVQLSNQITEWLTIQLWFSAHQMQPTNFSNGGLNQPFRPNRQWQRYMIPDKDDIQCVSN